MNVEGAHRVRLNTPPNRPGRRAGRQVSTGIVRSPISLIRNPMEEPMSTTASYSVSGMTCSHCVAAVTEEVGRLAGVSAVDVDLNAGGDSRVTVTSEAPLPVDAVRTAVDEAGYALAS